MTRRFDVVGMDFGFTLVNHVRPPVRCLQEALARRGRRVDVRELEPHQPAVALCAAELGSREGWYRCLHAYYTAWLAALPAELVQGESGQSLAEDVIRAYESPENWTPMDGALTFLRRARHHGLSLAILSNWGPGLDDVVQHVGWTVHFSAVLSSSLIGCAKPSPMAFGRLCEACAVAPERVLFVGDDYEDDCRAAAGLGMRALHVRAGASAAATSRIASAPTLDAAADLLPLLWRTS